jgi:hypothetical protein
MVRRHPFGSRARFAVLVAHRDHVAEANDVVEPEFGEKLVELLIAEAAVGHDRYLDALGQHLFESLEKNRPRIRYVGP